MHSSQLLSLAGLLTTFGPIWSACRSPIPPTEAEQYWVVSKCRLERWIRSLRSGQLQLEEADPEAQRECFREQLQPTIEEILLSDGLTRVWTALLLQSDHQQHVEAVGPFAQSVFLAQIEASNRAYRVLLDGRGVPVEEAVRVNRLRRRCQRWTDLLLEYLQPWNEFVPLVAEDPQRLTPAGAEGARWPDSNGLLATLPLLDPVAEHRTANPDLNREIATSILSCLPREGYLESGPVVPGWLQRMYLQTECTQLWLDQLLGASEGEDPEDGSIRRSGFRV